MEGQEWTTEIIKVIDRWKTTIRENRDHHQEKAIVFNKRFYQLGVVATVSGSLSMLSQLITFDDCTSTNIFCTNRVWINLIIAILTAITLIPIGLQTFLSYQKRAGKHYEASISYEALLNWIENTMVLNESIRGDPEDVLHSIKTQYDEIVKRSPIIPRDRRDLDTKITENDKDVILHVPCTSTDHGQKYKLEMRQRMEQEKCNARHRNYGLGNALSYQMQRLNARSEQFNHSIENHIEV